MLPKTQYIQLLWKVARLALWWIGISYFCMFSLFLLRHIYPLLTREMLDTLSGDQAVGFGIWTILALMVATGGSRIACWAGIGLFVARVYGFLRSYLCHNLLHLIFQKPGASYLASSAGDIISRFDGDNGVIIDFVTEDFGKFLGSLLFSIVALVILFQINTQLTVLLLIPTVLIALISSWIQNKIKILREQARTSTGQVKGFMEEALASVLTVKLNGAEQRFVNRFEELSQTRKKLDLKEQLFGEIANSSYQLITTVGIALILIFTGQLIAIGEFTVGDFALFVFYLDTVGEFITRTGELKNQFKQTSVSLNRVLDVAGKEKKEDFVKKPVLHLFGPNQTFPIEKLTDRLSHLEIKNLSYQYPGTTHGIHDISFKIHEGAFVVITGDVGSGKTTLLRVLLGLLPKAKGEIFWNGQLITDPSHFFVPPQVAYTSQMPKLFSGTLRENILLGAETGSEAIEDSLYSAVLEEDILHLEKGLETQIGTKGVKLSGGQIQRTAAARMFMRQSDFLVFDDLSSALDLKTEIKLWERVFEKPSKTCLVVTHRKIALAQADHIIVLRQGSIAQQGTLEELKESSPEIQRIWQNGKEQRRAI